MLYALLCLNQYFIKALGLTQFVFDPNPKSRPILTGGGSLEIKGTIDLRIPIGDRTILEVFHVVDTNAYHILLGKTALIGVRISPMNLDGKVQLLEIQKDFHDFFIFDDEPIKMQNSQSRQTWFKGTLLEHPDEIKERMLFEKEEDEIPETLGFGSEKDRSSYDIFMSKLERKLEQLGVTDLLPILKEIIPEEICARSLRELHPDGALGPDFQMKVTSEEPINSKPYRLGYVLEQILEEEIMKYVDSGRWCRGRPKWTSPVFLHLVPKTRDIPTTFLKNQLKNLHADSPQKLKQLSELLRIFYSVRLVHDYRRVNARTILDNFPMPDLQDFRKFIAGSKVFSVVDLKSAFYQIRLSQPAQDYLGIIAPSGTFIPKFLDFGPKNAPAASSRLLADLLNHKEFDGCVMGRIDDIIVATSTLSEHLRILRILFQRLKEMRLGN
eukprot:TRINITY_DN22643_c0_g1_i1.p1 TRINITY_DN22643_c0_g1~~TRINITY_DN22643_c0_g1_i1.p1  ORF type:complete len:440 (-),score=113.96 TRINITY_DN22643_c0_g1_i1:1893-3212(-)